MPIYNNEATLRRAIESILNQSVIDFELILINDGSTDSSAQICRDYAKREPLIIRVIHQEQLGFARTRNRGLDLAKGSYIYFADAENILAPRMFETNIRIAEENNAELVVFGFIEANEAIEQVPRLPYLLSKERFRNHYRNFHNFFPYELCNKLYQIHYLKERNIKFHNYPLKEKAFFNLAVYQELNKVVFNRNVLCQKTNTSIDYPLEYEEMILDTHYQLIADLEETFSSWELADEFEDLVIREYFQLLETQMMSIFSPSWDASTIDLESEVHQKLSDERIIDVLNSRKEIVTKSVYERMLWNYFQKRNARSVIKLMHRKKQRTDMTENIKEQLNKWFSN